MHFWKRKSLFQLTILQLFREGCHQAFELSATPKDGIHRLPYVLYHRYFTFHCFNCLQERNRTEEEGEGIPDT